MVCCKSFGKLNYLFLGLAAGCSVAAMLLLVIYFGTWVNTTSIENEPQGYEQYYFGRRGQIGQLAYLLASVPILCLAFLAVGVVFFICCCDKCCCKVIAWVFSMIGCALFLIIILGEIIMVKFSEYGADESYANQKGYDKTGDTEFLTYAATVTTGGGKQTVSDGPRQIYYTQNGGQYKEDSVPVCYFDTLEKLRNYEAADCIGRWSGGKLKSYMEKKNKHRQEETDKEQEFENDDEGFQQWSARRNVHAIFFSLYTTQSVTAIALGLSLAAVVCGVIWVFMRCCCVKSDK